MANAITTFPVDWRQAGASKGVALTTTKALTVIPSGTSRIVLRGYNYTTAVVARWAACPYFWLTRTFDGGVTVADESVNAQDGVAGTVVTLSAIPTLANGGQVLIASRRRFRGLSVTVGSANAVASVLSAHYWNGSWTSLAPTDGTISSAKTFAVSGDITWTLPTDWARISLHGLQGASTVPVTAAFSALPTAVTPLYFARLTVSAALTNPTTATGIVALNEGTTYSELVTGQDFTFDTRKDLSGIAGIEALTDAGTANLLINCGASSAGFD